MKNLLLVFFFCLVGERAFAQQPIVVYPQPVPVVPVYSYETVIYQPVMVQEVRLVPVVEQKIVSYPVIVSPVYTGVVYETRPRWFRPWIRYGY